MTTLREAAQQALEALKNNAGEMRVEGAIRILETALAEPVQLREHCLWARNGNEPCPHVQQAQPVQDTDCHAQGICQRSGYSLGQRMDAITALKDALNKPQRSKPQRPDGMKDVYARLREKAMRSPTRGKADP